MNENPNPIAAETDEFMQRIKKMEEAIALKSPEQVEREAKAFEERAKEQHNDRVREVLSRAEIPKRHLKTHPIRSGEWQEVETKLSKLLGKGFLVGMIGGRGNGKTQIGVELIRRCAQALKSCRFCTAFEFFMEVKAGYNNQETTEKDVIWTFQRPSLLVIDEISKRSESEWENRLLYELINRRYNDLKDTLIISNQDAQALADALGDSIVSRMRETGGVIECNWQTFRP